jgi:hypothetical protein
MTLYNEADTTNDMLKNATLHIAGISNSGTHKDQKVMEYYVQFKEDDDRTYPKAHSTLDVVLYSDYGIEHPSDNPDEEYDYRWEVSLIGNTEFFIKKQ